VLSAQRTYHVLGVPLRAGSLYPGSENDAQAYRDADLVGRLRASGRNVIDAGDVAIPSYVPHHSVPPIRNWPAPRIAWDCIAERVGPIVREPGRVPFLIGCDCSAVVGSTHALLGAASDPVHVLYVDGDFDDAPPEPARCQSAAALAVWLLTNPSPFWAGPHLAPAHVSVLGASTPSAFASPAVNSLMLDQVRRVGPRAAAQQVLERVPPTAQLLLHLDIDVFARDELPGAYFPHASGLRLAEGAELLRILLQDPRLRLVEVSEYAALADHERTTVRTIVDLLASALAPSGASA
jgi:arginase